MESESLQTLAPGASERFLQDGANRGEVRRRAAQLAADDTVSDREIAQVCGIHRRTLARWKQQEAFQRDMDEHLRNRRETAEAGRGAEKQRWIGRLDRQWRDLQEIIRQRADRPALQRVPGGTTGLLIPHIVVGGGGQMMVDYHLDCRLLRAMRRLEVQVSKQLNQWQKPLTTPALVPLAETEGRVSEFWSGKRERAAFLCADDTKSDIEIAAACGMNRRTLYRLKRDVGFVQRVEEIRTSWENGEISDKYERLWMVNWRYQKLEEIMEERGRSPGMERAPGGRTGLVYVRHRWVDGSWHSTYHVDYGWLRESRLHMAQVANELGDWNREGQTVRAGRVLTADRLEEAVHRDLATIQAREERM